MNVKLTSAERRELLKKHQLYLALFYFVLGLTLGLACMLGLAYYGTHGPKENFLRDLFQVQEIDQLNTYLTKLERDSEQLREELRRTQELVKIDRRTRADMTLLINNLESENARLKEDLAFFEGFVPGTTRSGITLRRLQVDKDTVPNQYRYRALALQGAQKPSVTLSIQVLVTVSINNETEVLVFPLEENAADKMYTLDLKRFARLTGTFRIPEKSQLEQVEIRLLETDAIRAQATIQL